MSFRCFNLLKALVVPSLMFGFLFSAVAEEPTVVKDAKGRKVVHDERPDDSRGWTIISKAAYWPLCYESLDRLEETGKLIGNADAQELANALDKSAAWLALASSAAMTDSHSGTGLASDLFSEAAESIRTGTNKPSDADLKDLVTLALLSMAKSHVLRANAPDESFVIERASPNKTATQTAELKTASREIAKERMEGIVAQYRYDAIQSQRHLETARTYLEAAAKSGGFTVDDAISAEIPEVITTEKPAVLVEYVEDHLRPRIKSMTAFINAQRAPLVKKLNR